VDIVNEKNHSFFNGSWIFQKPQERKCAEYKFSRNKGIISLFFVNL
jgi:hypothetical protein